MFQHNSFDVCFRKGSCCQQHLIYFAFCLVLIYQAYYQPNFTVVIKGSFLASRFSDLECYPENKTSYKITNLNMFVKYPIENRNR